ncbi:MAG: META domain-containing protein [Chitinophagaceae bacterium]
MLLSKIYHLLIVFSICLLIWSCGTSKNVTNVQKTITFEESLLMGTPWRLYAYEQNKNLHQVDSAVEVTITFEHPKEAPTTTKFYGRAACNRYFGGCSIKERKLSIQENMGITRMMCAHAEMEMETLYIRLLPKMSKIEFIENSKTQKIDLILSNENHEKLIFLPYNLE